MTSASPLPYSFKIFSFYNSKVPPLVPLYQKAVFNHLGFTIHHFVDEQITHGNFLNHICRTVLDTDYLIFFDVDCIPVNANWLNTLIADIQEPHSIAGAAQTANHLREGKNLYVSPFFFGISTKYLKELGYPDMNETNDMDVGQNLTEKITLNNGAIKYWWPTEMEEEQWNLYHPEHTKFGPGTTYNNLIYHAFLSRFDTSGRFIKKCKTILPWYTKFKLGFARKKRRK
ncbi:MAG: hypothetical protein QM802_25455 [Agriterribacter sp.]